MILSLILAAIVAPAGQAVPFAPPYYRPSDPRIQQVVYDPNQVVPLQVGRGYAAVIDLGRDQVVESVVVGNGAGWEVTASKRGDHIVVKPLEGAAVTDMIVITADRRYVFLIQPGEGTTSFVLSFAPPGPVPLALSPAPQRAGEGLFTFRGAKALFPLAMRTDGQRTYVTWSKASAIPAVFAVEDGHEAIVNGRMAAGDYVIEGAASRYVFRLGKERATAVRRRSKPSR